MAWELRSIESTVFVIFVSVILYVVVKPDKTTESLCTGPIHDYGDQMKLKDGRNLSYASYGPPNAFPVIHFHPMPSSRLFHHVDIDKITHELGVRLIIPDRPGIGRSSPSPGRTLLHWADDVLQLANHLGFQKFSVSGHSAGGPHALAVAFKLPHRIERVATIGAVIYPTSVKESSKTKDWEGLLTGMRPANTMMANLGMDHSWVLAILWKLMTGTVVDVNTTIDDLATFPSESYLFQNPSWRSLFYHSAVESFRQGTSTLYDELSSLIPKDWGFHIRDINVPVDVWHGREDNLVTMTMAKYLANHIPGAKLHVLEGKGHFSLWDTELRDILTNLLPRTEKGL